jgi:hypothetical protein
MTLNKEACARYSLTPSLSMATNKSVKIAVEALEPTSDSTAMTDDVRDRLLVKALVYRHKTTFGYYGAPSENHVSFERYIELETPVSRGTLVVMPCPYHHLFLNLSEDEYEQVRLLKPATKFVINDIWFL